jgi:signal transduction histidine kinase
MPNTSLELPTQVDLVRFISHYAHDLRSPFNRVVGFTKILLKGQDGPLTDLQKEDLNTVYHNGVYSFMLVNNLIDIARIIGGEKSLNPAEGGINYLIEQAIAHWKKYHPDKDVQFETVITVSSLSIRVDELQLRPAIAGLVACVVECVEQPAKVTIKADEEAAWVVMTISSEGKPAMNPSRLDLDMYGYIGRALIELHGGEIRLQEVGDEGASICFALPKP